MTIIKLNAIDSTNSYLKKLVSEKNLKDYTTIVAEEQLKGRGQMGTLWESGCGKNLTVSVLKRFSSLKIEDQFYFNMCIALAVLQTVKEYVKLSVKIKWPNDILAGQDKLAGILIENMINGKNLKHAVIGIGLNVNQADFSKDLENVTSLKLITKRDFDKDKVLEKLLENIKYFAKFIEQNQFDIVKEMYVSELYKFDIPSMFREAKGNLFMGRIVDISTQGELIILLENETTRKFNLKEIKFASR